MTCQCKTLGSLQPPVVDYSKLEQLTGVPVVIKNLGNSITFGERREQLMQDAYIKGLGGINNIASVYTVQAGNFDNIVDHAKRYYDLSIERIISIEQPFVQEPVAPTPTTSTISIWAIATIAVVLIFFRGKR